MMNEEAKKTMRAYMRSRIADKAADISIWQQVEALKEFKEASSFLIYWSMPSEVSTRSFIDRWYGRKRVFLPRVADDRLEIREYNPETMVEGYRGIMEPSEEAVAVTDVDLAIVPGMAFDASGNRLGRGGGFYDRLLPSLYCPKIGVCRLHQLVDEVPVQPWDSKVDIVVTPANCYICKI